MTLELPHEEDLHRVGYRSLIYIPSQVSKPRFKTHIRQLFWLCKDSREVGLKAGSKSLSKLVFDSLRLGWGSGQAHCMGQTPSDKGS